MIIELPYLGYLPGQEVKFKIFVENQSFISIEKIKINFKKFVRLSSDKFNICNYDETKIYENIIQGVHEECVEDSFELPKHLSSSDTKHCSLIQTFYELKIVAVVAGPYENLEVKIPIFIGSTGFHDKHEISQFKSNNRIDLESLQPYNTKEHSILKHRKVFIITIFVLLSIFYVWLIPM
jgi:hypothetical protein